MTEETRKYHNKYILTLVLASIVLFSSGILAHNAFADQMVSTISLGKYVAGSVAVNPQTNMIYVVNPVNNTVSVIDGSSDSVVSTIPVLPGPSGIAVNPITNKIYVSHPSVGNVTVIDGATNSVVDTISAPGTPTCIATNPSINMIYVLQSSNKNVAIIDGLSNKIVQNIPYRSGYSVYTYCLGVNPSTDKFYVTWATNPDTHMDDYVNVIDGSTYDSINVHTGIAIFSTSDYGIDKKSNMIYVLNGPSYDNFITINGTSNSVVGTMRVQDNSNGMDVNPYTHNVYLANRDNNTIYVINGATSTISNTIPVGKSPVDVAVNPNTDKIYVVNQGDNTVSVIQGSAPPPQITTSQLRVNSRDALGNILTGFQTLLYAQNGTQIGTGNTSHSYMLDNGQSYTVHVEDKAPFVFDHWADTSSTSATRNISISSDDAIIAIYKTLPQSPTGLNATVITSSQINLSWTGPSYDGGSPILGYKIERSTDAGSTWSTAVADTSSTQTTYSDSTINANMTYTYRVSAINSVGSSIPSSTAVATSIVLNNAQSTSGTVTSLPYSITLANFNSGTGNNRLLVVGVSANNNNVASITFNKVPLTMTASSFYNNDAEFWYLTNPSGTGDIVVTMTNSTSAVVGAYSFSGVDLTNPISTIVANHNNATGSPSISLMASYPTSLVLDLPSISGWHTLSNPVCTPQWNVNMPNTITGASSSTITSSPGQITCSWIASGGGDLWDDVAIEVKALGSTSKGTSPDSPTGLKANVISSSQINLSWTAPVNTSGSPITNYKVYKSTSSGTETLFATIGNVTSYNDGTVTNGQTYFYTVTAVNSVGESQKSNEASATPSEAGVTVKSVDENNNPIYGIYTLLCSQGTSQTANGSNTCETGSSRLNSGFTTVTFDVPQGQTFGVEVYNNASCSFNHWSDNTGNTYQFRLFTATNPPTILTSVYSCGNTMTVPQSPTGVVANSITSSQINLSWIAPTNNGGSVITKYNVYRGTTSGNETLFAQTGNVTSYTDNAVVIGQTYFYKITAVNVIGESPQSNEVSATLIGSPQPPTGLTATGALLKINLNWTAPSNDGGSAITGYSIERSTDNGSTWSTVQSNTGSTATTYSDSNVVPLVTYTYRVSAINSVGTSNPSNIASATTTSSSTNGITLNNVQSTSGTTSSNQITLPNFDSGNGNNKLLVVGVGADSSDVNSITFNGISMTRKAGSFYNNDAEFWYLKNPSGTGDIVVTMNGQTSAVVGAYSFSGVNQTAPLPTSTTKHNTSPNNPNITITTKFANDWMLDLPSIYGGSTLGSPTCTQQWDANVPDTITGASSSKIVPTPGAVTCKWTASSDDLWDDVAVEIKASK